MKDCLFIVVLNASFRPVPLPMFSLALHFALFLSVLQGGCALASKVANLRYPELDK